MSVFCRKEIISKEKCGYIFYTHDQDGEVGIDELSEDNLLLG